MRIKNLILASLAALLAMVSCEVVEDLGMPSIKLDGDGTMTFDVAGGDQQINLTATRDWMVETDADWVMVSPDNGKASAEAQTVTVTALENKGMDRTAVIKFTIGMSFQTLTVTQAGPGGSTEDLELYVNDFDKTTSAKVDGYWPYLDEFDGWMNARGRGADNVVYKFKSASARATSSNNNIWLPKTGGYFSVQGIALDGTADLQLSFNVICGSPGSYKKTFSSGAFKVYMSADNAKWVDVACNVTENAEEFDNAVVTFSVPANTESLSITFEKISDDTDGYRIDEVKLVASAEAGTQVDFSQGVEKTYDDGNEPGGGEDPQPPVGEGTLMTIAEVLQSGSSALPSGAYVEAVVISDRSLNNLTSKKGLYVQDETAGLQFYLAANHELNFGDKVKIDLSGVKLADYNGAVQVSGLALDKISTISTGNSVTAKTVSIDDFLANKYEGQYVAIEGVQVVEADLARTFVEGEAHTSINVETADGKTFAIFSSKYATYGTETVPQGSGTIKGISSISKGAMQVIFAQASDYAGLTGERFDGNSGGEVTPPAGGDDEGTPESPKKVTIAEFLAAPVSSDFWYELTGEIISIAKEDYGNFTIKDSTGEVYIYGMTNGWVGSNDKSFSQIGLKVGDTVTLGTLRGEYNGTPQGGGNKVPAFYISHVPGTGGDNGDNGEGGEVTPPTGEGDAVLTFPDGNSKSVNSYTDTWEAVSGGYTWTLKNFNNNQNNWAYVKCGRKSDPSVASISVAVAAKVSEVVVAVDNCLDETKVNSAKLIVASDANFENVVETVSGSAAKGNQSFAVSTPAEGMYYKVEYDCSAHGSKNGIVQISKVTCVTVK